MIRTIRLAGALLLAMAYSAVAGEPPRLNLKQPITDPKGAALFVDDKGNLVPVTACQGCQAVTVAWVLGQALAYPACPPQGGVPECTDVERRAESDPLIRWGRMKLADQWQSDATAAIGPEMVLTLKLLIGARFYSPLIIAQVFPLLDPTAKPADLGGK